MGDVQKVTIKLAAHLVTAVAIGLILTGCSRTIETHAQGAQALGEISDQMAVVLDDVTDEASASEAIPRFEALAREMKDVFRQIQALGEPTFDEIQAMGEAAASVEPRRQALPLTYMIKLGRYPQLMQAWERAMLDE